MRALLVPVAVAAAISAVSVASAAQRTTGDVKSFNMKAHTLTLSSGTTYTLPKSFKDPGLKAGEKVKVTWDMLKGRHAATDVIIVK